VAAPQLGRAQLEEKDRDDLAQIASALGLKGVAKADKAALIEKILEETMAPEPKESAPKSGSRESRSGSRDAKPATKEANPAPLGADGEPLSDWEIELAEHEGTPIAPEARAEADSRGRDRGDSRGDRGDRSDRGDRGDRGDSRGYRDRNFNDRGFGDGGGRNRRRRGRRRGGGRDDGPQGDDRFEIDQIESNEPVSTEPVKVEGYLDLRDEGYGFLRIGGYLPTRNDAYVSVRFTRQFGLRKGDHVTGLSRPAGRNEKNPALLEIYTVNGGDPEKARNRKKFEDLTPLFPDEKLGLSTSGDPLNMTARIIDLISPIGKGQRGIIVSPPKAGKTTVMKTIATSIEKNHPEVKLIVLLIDERPEEVTDMRRTVKGEVIASTFDRPSDEHTAVAELAIEKAKRMVEAGEDVVVILDGITRLSRAYNLAAPATGRIMSGGIDAGALYPPKKFFGAARNIEEGGSLTILATALVETNSRMDEAIFEEFKGTGNMELRLDRRLAERRIYPAIDVDASSTRHEELLFDRKQLQMVWKLRRVLSGLAADGNAAPGLELLIDRLKSFKTNDEFLSEIAKQPTA
jgi:transcription termination factor Rho